MFHKIRYLFLFACLISFSSKAMDMPSSGDRALFFADMTKIKKLIDRAEIKPIFEKKELKQLRQKMKTGPTAPEHELKEGVKGYRFGKKKFLAVDYKVLIAETSLNRIYSAQNLKSGEVLIMKHRKRPLATKEVAQFAREWLILETLKLSRANMMEAMGADSSPLRMTFMAYVPGINMEEALEELPTSPIIKAAIAGASYKALYDLHWRGIFHGDIKLNNMLLDIKDGMLFVKFVDFEGSMFINDPQRPFCISEDMLPPGFDHKIPLDYAMEYYLLGKSMLQLFAGKIEKGKLCDHHRNSSQCVECAPQHFKQEFSAILADSSNQPSFDIIRRLSLDVCDFEPKNRTPHDDIAIKLKEFEGAQKRCLKKLEISKKLIRNSL